MWKILSFIPDITSWHISGKFRQKTITIPSDLLLLSHWVQRGLGKWWTIARWHDLATQVQPMFCKLYFSDVFICISWIAFIVISSDLLFLSGSRLGSRGGVWKLWWTIGRWHDLASKPMLCRPTLHWTHTLIYNKQAGKLFIALDKQNPRNQRI